MYAVNVEIVGEEEEVVRDDRMKSFLSQSFSSGGRKKSMVRR